MKCATSVTSIHSWPELLTQHSIKKHNIFSSRSTCFSLRSCAETAREPLSTFSPTQTHSIPREKNRHSWRTWLSYRRGWRFSKAPTPLPLVLPDKVTIQPKGIGYSKMKVSPMMLTPSSNYLLRQGLKHLLSKLTTQHICIILWYTTVEW